MGARMRRATESRRWRTGRMLRRGSRLAAALLATGCSTPAPEVAIDLLELFPDAEVVREVSLIDLGTLEAREHLGAGWSIDETRRDGTTMVWAVGGRSELNFFLTRPRDLTLELRCTSFRRPGGLPQRADVHVNERSVGTVTFGPGLEEYRVPVAAGDTVAGSNLVELRFDSTGRPSDHGVAGDDRELTARLDFVRLVGVPDSGIPSIADAGRELVIPAGAELGFFLEPGREALLTLDGLDVAGDVHLEVRWLVDDGSERLLGSLRGDGRPPPVVLPDREGQPIRMGLRCVGDAGVVAVVGPRVTWVSDPAEGVEPEPAARRAGLTWRAPNVVVYLVDTLRADRLGCYGNPSGLSPHADALARDGVLFEHAVAHCSWTTPSVVSILTGLRPSRHGVNSRLSVLPDEAVTAAELLREAGYQTAGYSTNAYITERAGFDQGFDHFEFSYRRSHEVTAAVAAWLEERDRNRPFFLYVHTIDPHAPYDPGLEYRQRFAPDVRDPKIGTTEHLRALGDKLVPATDEVTADLRRLYDAEVAENDDALGRLVEALRQNGLWEDTVVVFVADHGEEFREHGVFGHGWDLYGEVLDVPLIVRAPGGLRGKRVGELVQHTDVLPTVLDAVGVAIPPGLDGMSLWDVIHGAGRPPGDRAALSYMDYEGRRGIAVATGRWKLIVPLSPNFMRGRELYDRDADPGELENVAERFPVRSGSLAALARREIGRRTDLLPSAEGAEPGGDTRRGLEALGYLR